MRTKLCAMFLMVLLLGFVGLTNAQIPRMVNYQGKITTATGALVDAVVAMQFSIYTDSVGGTELWTETQPSVTVTCGIFSVLLGSVDEIPDSVFIQGSRYLAVKVGDDPEMVPRRQIVNSPYSFNSQRVGGARIEYGSGTTDPSGVVTVNFSTSFNSPPIVILTPKTDACAIELTSTSTNSFSVRAYGISVDVASAGDHSHSYSGATSVSSAGSHTHTYDRLSSIGGVTGQPSGVSVASSFSYLTTGGPSSTYNTTYGSSGSPGPSFATSSHTHSVPVTFIYNHYHSFSLSSATTGSGGSHTHTLNFGSKTTGTTGNHTHTVNITYPGLSADFNWMAIGE